MSKHYVELEKRHASEESKVQAENKRAELAEKEWETFSDLGTTGYLARKKIDKLYGARIGVDTGVHLVIPMRDLNGKLWGLQRISDSPREDWKGFDKWIDADTKMKGSTHLIGEIKEKLFLAEGFATGASVHMATGEAVLVCFNCWNMRDLAAEVRTRHPSTEIIICADDDKWTTNAKGEPWNPGLQAAHQAGIQAKARVIAPKFMNEEGRPSDFNDLHVREGLAEVREQLFAQPETTSILEEKMDLPAPFLGKQGKPIKMPEDLVVRKVIEHFGNNICRQGKDLFIYTGTHWRLLSDEECDLIQVRHIKPCFLGQAVNKDMVSAYSHFLKEVPKAPYDMFEPRAWCVNFLNGTLYVNEGKLSFGPHKREDYLINCIPFNYDPDLEDMNPEFDAMIERLFDGDEDKEEKKAAIQEMFGSCLLPAYPHIFMLHSSQGGTGKSTVIKLAAKMMSKENICTVEPCDFKNFGMETMAGKLVNIDPDITLNEPIKDAVIKKIVDNMPIRLQRKGKKDLIVPLPRIHIFGGNGIPPTLEGVSRAHNRRWTFLEFNNVFATDQHNFNFAEKVWGAGPQGILNYAVKGLRKLLEGEGKFTQPRSGKNEIEAWQLENDVVGSFFKAIKEGEIESQNQVLVEGRDLKMERPKLYAEFNKWREESGVKKHVSRIKFFKQAVRGKSTPVQRVVKTEGTFYVYGIGFVDKNNPMM
jgi:phage/plasmid-associated DNA primase